MEARNAENGRYAYLAKNYFYIQFKEQKVKNLF